MRLAAAASIVFFVAVFGVVAVNVGLSLLIVFALVAPCGVVSLVVIARSGPPS